MSSSGVSEILKEIDDLLATAGDLPPEAELAVEKLLNVVEALSSDKQSLVDEVQRLKQQLDQKKKGKTTGKGGSSKSSSDHSSEKNRRQHRSSKPTSAHDLRTFKDLTIDETIECPVDPKELPPDAVQVEDEEVIVQDIEIKPRNIRFQFDKETLGLLRTEFHLPQKWQHAIKELGDAQFEKASLQTLLDGWFVQGNRHLRIAIEQAAAIVYYRHQTSMPVVETIVCDDAGQFKLLTEKLALCWIHAGRHYEKLSPVAARHVNLLGSLLELLLPPVARLSCGAKRCLRKIATSGIRRIVYDSYRLRSLG